jgi:hypothetical protein
LFVIGCYGLIEFLKLAVGVVVVGTALGLAGTAVGIPWWVWSLIIPWATVWITRHERKREPERGYSRTITL